MDDLRLRREDWTAEALQGAFRAGVPEYVFYLMLQAVRRREAALNAALRPLGLNATRWHAGAVMRRTGGCSMADLANLSAVDRTTLTRTVDQMVQMGLAERETSPDDRRRVILRLTEHGKDLIDRAREISRSHNEGVLDGLDPTCGEGAVRLLQHVLAGMIDDDHVAWGVLTFTPQARH